MRGVGGPLLGKEEYDVMVVLLVVLLVIDEEGVMLPPRFILRAMRSA